MIPKYILFITAIIACCSAFPQPQSALGGNTLTPKDLRSYAETFNIFDKDGSGSVSSEEFRAMMETLGLEVPPPAVFDYVFETLYDKDGNGAMSFNEMIRFLSEVPKDARKQSAFSTFDSDKDNLISQAEMKFVMKALGFSLTDRQFNFIYAMYDVDNDGFLNYDEFVKSTNSKKK